MDGGLATRTRPSDSEHEQDAGHTGMETAGTNLFFTLLLRILGAANMSCCTLSGHLVEGLKAPQHDPLQPLVSPVLQKST